MKVISLFHDPDIEDPSENDGAWTVYSFSRRHRAFADPERFFPNGRPTIGLRRKLNRGLAFVLTYSEHGPCQWTRGNWPDDGPVRNQWDTVRFAGLLVWEKPPGAMGARTPEARGEDADHFLEVYTAWCNGEGYGYRVEDEDEDGNRTEIESVFGFYGTDLEYMASEIRHHVGDDPDIRVEGDATEMSAYMQLTNPPVGPPHGPWTPHQALHRGEMDLDDAAVWSDYSAEQGHENLAIDLNELKRLREKLK